MKSAKCVIITVVAAVFLCAACSAVPKSGSADVIEESLAAPAETAKISGGELFIAMPANIESFNPVKANSEDLINLLSLLYETPLKYESDGRLTNCLVQDWKVDDSKTEYTFTLRDDVYFSDGETKLTVDDILFSASEVMKLSGKQLHVESQDSDVENIDDAESAEEPAPEDTAAATEEDDSDNTETLSKNRYAQFNEYIEGIQKIDDHKFVLTMNKPGNAGLHFMTFPVMNEALVGEGRTAGTGPYRIDSYTEDEEMVLLRNDQWWNGKAYIDKIVARAVTGNTQKLEFEQTSIVDFVTTDVLYSGKYKSPHKTQVVDYMTNYYDCLIPNQISTKMKDVNIRQAISCALDRREILSTVLLNHGVPTNLPLAPDFYAYDSKYKISDYDKKMAKELLELSGYRTEAEGEGKQLELNMIFPNDRTQPYRREAAKVIKKQLEEVGIIVKLLDPLGADGHSDPEGYLTLLKSGNFDLAYCSFYTDIAPDLHYLLGTGGEGNYGHVQNEDIDNAIAACELAVTEDETMAAYEDLQRVLSERVPQIGLYYRMNSIICDDGIRNIKNPRQNAIFANIADWYISYAGEAALPSDSIEETPVETSDAQTASDTPQEEEMPAETADTQVATEAPQEIDSSAEYSNDGITVENTME